MPDTRPTLSVIVATRQGWPSIEQAIGDLVEQVEEVGGELIVLDASGREPPALPGHVRWLQQPDDLSVFQLRERGYREATADVVALTEDHCHVMPGWCRRILELHSAHPEAAAVGGSVANGTRDSDIDWAAFLVTQLPYTAPLPDGPSPWVTGPANLSLKRRAIERLPDNKGFGTIELFDQSALLAPGDVFWLENGLVVDHYQSLGFGGTSVIEFHNGRALGGFRRRAMSWRDLVRVLAMPLVLGYRIVRTIRMARTRQVPSSAVRAAAPAIAWLHACASAGELVGYVLGPGDSAQRLR